MAKCKYVVEYQYLCKPVANWPFGDHFPKLIPDDDLPRWCRLCGHVHHGDCQDDADNSQFRCHCMGECPHGRFFYSCKDCPPK